MTGEMPAAERRRGSLRLFLAYAEGIDAEQAMVTEAAEAAALGHRVAMVTDDATWSRLARPVGLVRAGPDAPARGSDLVLVAGGGLGRHVEAILAAGADVWFGLELRQVPELADLARSIAGPGSRELVPRSLLDAADTMELVDVLPDALLAHRPPTTRGRPPDRSGLFALRELAMRHVADRARRRSGKPPGVPDRSRTVQARRTPAATRRTLGFLGALLLIAAATGIAAVFDVVGLGAADQVLVYLLAVTATAAWCGRLPSVAAAIGAVLCFNFLFTEPRYTLAVQDPGALFTLGVLLVIGLLVSGLLVRLRERTVVAQQRELRAELLARLGQELSGSTGTLQIVAAAEERLRTLLHLDAAILLPRPDDSGALPAAPAHWPDREGRIRTAARDAHALGVATGAGTAHHGDAPAMLLPLLAPDRVLGVLAVRADGPTPVADADRRRLLDAFAAHIALALQRDLLTEEVHRTLAEAETERLRSAVLSSVSHDFRTPLAAIAGTASNLLDAPDLPRAERIEQVATIRGEAERLSRLVDNLLQMTRIEAGRLAPVREWHVVEDLVGSAITRLSRLLGDRSVPIAIAPDLPMVRVDGVLVELVLVNVIENAVQYSPPGSPIEVTACLQRGRLVLAVADRGPGLTAEELQRAFEKFYRGPGRRTDGSRGSGLGLAICSAIAALHGGSMLAENRPDGGARFALELPVEAQPPELEDTLPEAAPPEPDAP